MLRETHNNQIDILSDLSADKTIALRSKTAPKRCLVPLNTRGDISIVACLNILSLTQENTFRSDWQHRAYRFNPKELSGDFHSSKRLFLPLPLLHSAKLPLNLVIKSPQYAFSQRQLQILSNKFNILLKKSKQCTVRPAFIYSYSA